MNLHRSGLPDGIIEPSQPVIEPEESGFDLRALIAKVWRGKWIVAVCVVVALCLGFLAVSQMKPVYRASAMVLFEGQQANITDIEDVVVSSYPSLENQMQILRSTNLLGRVVDRLNLTQNASFNPRLRPQERTIVDRLRSLFDWRTYVSSQLLADLGIVDAPPPPPTTDAERTAGDRRWMINILQGGLFLEPVGDSLVLRVGFESHDPRLAALIANTVAQEYIQDQLQAKLETTRQASVWLSARIDDLRGRVETAELAVEQVRAQLVDEAGQTAAITRQQLEALNGALATVRAERVNTEALYNELSAALQDRNADLGTISAFRESPVISSMRQQESDLLGQNATLEAFARNSPGRARLIADIARVQRLIREEAERIVTALDRNIEVARTREAALSEEISALEDTEEQQRKGEIELRQLEREAQASRVVYESFLGRLEETSQQESLQTADARILSPAEPGGAVGTAKNRTLMMSVILGIGAGVGIIFLLDRLNNTFRGVDELERATGLPVLATLPSVGNDAERAEVVEELRTRPNGQLAEAVRNLRTSIMFSSGGDAPRVVIFTSSVPREGKSTTSLLMALTSQQMGRSAIIVDCDLRLHALSTLVGQNEGRPGLLAVIDGEATVEEALYTDPDTGLKILTARPNELAQGRSAADIVASQSFANLVTLLTKSYDLVMLDTPPSLVVTDTRVISRLADAVVFAVRWDSTPRGAVLEGLKEMTSVNAPMAGLVMTMVDSERVASYAYEGYGYYRSRYLHYYS